jgi:hypothetical protein
MRRLTFIGISAKKQAALDAPQRSSSRRPGSARRYWSKADINQPTVPAESVENDPEPTSRCFGLGAKIKNFDEALLD